VLTPVVVVAGCFVGIDTGLQLRRLIAKTRSEMDDWFPALAAVAPLITGVAITQSILLVLLKRWPELTYTVSGPLLTIYGLVWFQNSLAQSRFIPAPERPLLYSTPFASGRHLSAVPLRIGLGMQLGLLLCALGALDLISLLSSLFAAALIATAPDQIILPLDIRSKLVRGVAGAVLFLVGAAVVLQLVRKS
jgi:hypothetical protein